MLKISLTHLHVVILMQSSGHFEDYIQNLFITHRKLTICCFVDFLKLAFGVDKTLFKVFLRCKRIICEREIE